MDADAHGRLAANARREYEMRLNWRVAAGRVRDLLATICDGRIV